MSHSEFASVFSALTGAATPFPWQVDLFNRFAEGTVPACCDLPTGLGKTSVAAVWLIALAKFPSKIPRRLVYIVNRRTVVDQTTFEVEKLRSRLEPAGLKDSLARLCVLPCDTPLAISTLRGQFADNHEWSADPCRPAVIIGTVDMMGSRLLFGGYRLGFKTKPLHAGFLGQDTLIIHDEAHLEPAFQDLLTALENEQSRCGDARKIRVIELSATPRSEGEPFGITRADEQHAEVAKRLEAPKTLHLHGVDDATRVQPRIIELALRHKDSRLAVLVFANRVKEVEQIAAELAKVVGKENVERLTGTMRGMERDGLVKTPVFRRFLPPGDAAPGAAPAAEGTVYLVCTSAGEVGINISADHLVCDLSTFDSMTQRFGRVNRFGLRRDSQIDVTHPSGFDQQDKREQRRAKTLEILQLLNGRASTNAIRAIDPAIRRAAFNPLPTIRPVSDILFDAWSLTTFTGNLPGRPAVAPYLHGILEGEIPETQVAWREEVGVVSGGLRELYDPQELLADCPLKPHELLRDDSSRVAEALGKLVSRNASKSNLPVWLIDDEGAVEVVALGALVDKKMKERMINRTVLMPPEAGGLRGGLLDPSSDDADDVADEWRDEHGRRRRARVWDDEEEVEEKTGNMRPVREINIRPFADEDAEEEDKGPRRFWRWLELPRSADSEGSRSAREDIQLEAHTRAVESVACAFAEKSGLTTELVEAVRLAGKFHDLGKRRRVWQLTIGNLDPDVCLAKSRKGLIPHQLNSYRHEFGSLLDLNSEPEFLRLSDAMKDLILQLVAAHHGRARPHFPAEEAFDPDHSRERATALRSETARRFARLQRTYGRWGLAWLESLVRAADYAASANPKVNTGNQS
jgi:CRISPR-associated endonuclease/helicase Cas3